MRCARCCIQRCNKLNKCAIRQHCAQGLPWKYIIGQLHRKCMFTKWCASFRSVTSEDLVRHCNKVIFPLPSIGSLSNYPVQYLVQVQSLYRAELAVLWLFHRADGGTITFARGFVACPTSCRRPRGVARGSTVRSILATTSWPIYCAHSRVLRMSLTRAASAQPGATSLRCPVYCLAAPLATIAQYTWTLAT